MSEDSPKPRVYVDLPDKGEWEEDYLVQAIEYARGRMWSADIWHPQDALVDRSGGSTRLYRNQRFDPAYFDLVRAGWTHDHCDICWATLVDQDNGASSEGTWLCTYCYEHFIKPDAYRPWFGQLKRVRR